MRVLVADDHAIVRRGTRELIAERYPDAEFVEAGTGEAAVAMADGRFDLVVIDLGMPGRGGLDAVRELACRHPRMPIVVLSQHDEAEYAARALRAGAGGYVTKDSATDELVSAVESTLRGRKFVSAALAADLVGAVADESSRPAHSTLSTRELEVLKRIGRGMSLKEIGAELAISDKTAGTYRRRILEKLSLSSTADLIRYAIHAKLSD